MVSVAARQGTDRRPRWILTELQERTWRILAAVPEADGFALAGGSALILTGVVQRGSNDLDVFGTYPGSAIPFAEAAQRGLTSEGLNPTVERWGEGFVRMRVTDGADTTWVDIAIDVRRHPTVADPTGPVLNIRELAADKMLALVGRVAPRDYIDVCAITQRHHISDVIDWASDKDTGFTLWQIKDALKRFASIDRDSFELDTDSYQQLQRWVASTLQNLP